MSVSADPVISSSDAARPRLLLGGRLGEDTGGLIARLLPDAEIEPFAGANLTAAPLAAAALVVADARTGLCQEVRRLLLLAKLQGITVVRLVVDRLDAVESPSECFAQIAQEFEAFAGHLALADAVSVPLAELAGHMAGFEAPARQPFRMITRGEGDGGGLAGLVVGGAVGIGDAVTLLPFQRAARVERILSAAGEVATAAAGETVTLVLDEPIAVGGGAVICDAEQPADVTDQFAAHLLWTSGEPLLPHRRYLLEIDGRAVWCEVTLLKHRVTLDTLEHQAATRLMAGEIGFCNIALEEAVVYDASAVNPATGGFTVLDPDSRAPLGAGMIAFGLRRATNLRWQQLDVDKAARGALKGQRPCVIWLTGLSGSGKSTVANVVERKLHAMGRHTYLLDGDNVRHGLNKDLGFTDADRVENIRRIAEVAKLFVDAGLIVMTAFISPFRSERAMARGLLQPGEFIEVHVSTSLDECERRDPKGLYKKARSGKLVHFTGIDSPYEPPEAPEMAIDTVALSAEQAADRIIAELSARGMV